MQSLTLARVDQAVLRPALLVDHETDIVSVVRLFSTHRSTSVLVRPPAAMAIAGSSAPPPAPHEPREPHAPSDPPWAALGVFTTAGLQRAILSGRPLDSLPVGELASRPLVTIGPDAPLYDALATMVRHRVQRLVVVDPSRPAPLGGPVMGLLEQLDLLSFLSNHSYIITRQIIEAPDLAALRPAADQVLRVVGLLHRGGTHVGVIARLVQALHAGLMERAWQLVAPPELVAHSCLFVMGSEGRGEQLLKTDQDNGLVLRDGYEAPPDLDQICARFSQALADLGYPPCPGHIMVSNPQWRMPAAEFAETVRRWLLMPSADSLMALAIFMDAQAVAGDAGLLAPLRAEAFDLVQDNDVLLARFAAAISAFDHSAQGWRRWLPFDHHPPPLDLKKAGTFPLVHGVRSLALAHRITATGTVDRLKALVACQALDAGTANDLTESLHHFMGLKLGAGLAAADAGLPVTSSLHTEQLSHLDQALLKDMLAVVQRFKSQLERRFHLDAV